MIEVVIGGKVERLESPLEGLSYYTDGRLKLVPGEDMRRRTTHWIRSIVGHTTKGVEPVVEDGFGPNTHVGTRIAEMWGDDGRRAGAHLTVDFDGFVYCHADLLFDAAFHAVQINEFSIGIEMYQGKRGELYSGQLQATGALIDALCKRFSIQRQCPRVEDRAKINRIAQDPKSFVGVCGHRHIGGRGPGDPGDPLFEVLIQNFGFKAFNFDTPRTGHFRSNPEDIVFWVDKQAELGVPIDGIPGPMTCDALRESGCKYGLIEWPLAVK